MKSFAFAILLLASPFARAYESYYESTEAQARAGVDSGNWDLIHSSFNHPAELSKQNGWNIFFKTNLQVSEKTYNLILNPPEVKEGQMEEKLNKYFGEKYDVNGNAVVGFNKNSFVFIPYYKKARSSAQLNYKVYPEATGYIEMDTGYMIAYGKSFGRFSLGLNYFNFERNYDIYTVDLISSVNEQYELKDSERLYSINASASYLLDETPNKKSNVYITYKNLNNPNNESKYDQFNGDLIPLINLGFQKEYNNWVFDVNFLDMNNYYDSIWKNRVRVGAEYQFSKYALLRKASVGILDGSLSMGTSVNLLKVLNLSFSTYEKNMYHFYDKKNRFYSLSLELNF